MFAAFLWSTPIGITSKLYTNISEEEKEIPFPVQCCQLKIYALLLLPCQKSVLQKQKETIYNPQEKAALQDPSGYTNTELDNRIISSSKLSGKKNKCS